MFDISWTEFLLIGVVALVVIGPKELPGVLRTLGQWTRRVRGMAAEFQNQFQEAMREAEMADLKKEVDDITHGIKSYDPLKDVRSDLETAGKDIKSSLEQPTPLMTATDGASQPSAPVSLEAPQQDTLATGTGPVVPVAIEQAEALQPVTAAQPYAREAALVAAAIAPVVPEPVETAPNPDQITDQKPDQTGRE